MLRVPVRSPSGLPRRALCRVGVDSCRVGSIHGLRTDRLSYAATAVRPLKSRRSHPRAHPVRDPECERGRDGVRRPRGARRPIVPRDALQGAAPDPAERLDRLGARRRRAAARGAHADRRRSLRAADHALPRRAARARHDRGDRSAVDADADRAVLREPAALAGNPIGGYGPGAVGISAFSPVLLNWPQGGPIAIHGTNAPDLIGFAVSHGCLRVRNADARSSCDSPWRGRRSRSGGESGEPARRGRAARAPRPR